jgi:ABC-type multidrug transport system fused ATPase/permease subunit
MAGVDRRGVTGRPWAVALFTLLAFPMRVVGFLLEEMPRSVVALDRIDRVLEAAPEPTAVDPHGLPGGPLDVDAEALEYGYVAGVPVLQDCDVHITSGEVVALVGPTGCGKTTLCELLAGLDRPDKGVVRVGGIDLTEVTRETLRTSVALVFQESFLFTDTIANNITIGTEASETQLRWAAGIAQVSRFVDSLPAAYETAIGERGVTVSGGQRQRIAPRTPAPPSFLLLDDATSAVGAPSGPHPARAATSWT